MKFENLYAARNRYFPSLHLPFLTYYDVGTKVYPLSEVHFSWRRQVMHVNASKREDSMEKRLEKLGNIAVEIVNMLATRKVDGETINVADVYFVLSRALQHVSLLNLAEIEEHKRIISPAKKMIV